jgi:hypothetical protein
MANSVALSTLTTALGLAFVLVYASVAPLPDVEDSAIWKRIGIDVPCCGACDLLASHAVPRNLPYNS